MEQSFNKANLEKLVSGSLIGNRIHFFDEIDSTNTMRFCLLVMGPAKVKS